MNYKKILAAASAILMIMPTTGCGKDEKPELPEDIEISAVSGVVDTVDEEQKKTDEAVTKEKNDTKKDNEEEDEKKSKTSSTAIAKTEETTKTRSVSSGGNKGGSSGNTSGKQSGNSGNSGSSAKVTTKAVSTEKPKSVTTAVQTEPPAVMEKSYTAEISFNETATVKGDNATAEGSIVRITAGGEYRVQGYTSLGQICVDTVTEDKVEIILDGVDISNTNAPAIYVAEAKKCIIKIAGGSENYLSDNGKNKIEDGVIFSNDTLKIKGSGNLVINAGNAHGICSDDDVIIENGNIEINSKKSGIMANDDITISGGELRITGDTNGLKSKGTIHINGGTALVCGGSKEEKSSIYASGGLYYNGGYVYALGNLVTAPSETIAPYVVVSWKNAVPGDSTVGFVLGGYEMAELTAKSSFRCAMMLVPEIEIGDSFSLYVDGEAVGEYAVEEGQNIFETE